MTRFKSRQVNLDPESWADPESGKRYTRQRGPYLPIGNIGDDLDYAPRPEFEPTRDPKPWLTPGTFDAPGDTRHADRRSGSSFWTPRREQFDTPVNGVLVEFRKAVAQDDDGDIRLIDHWLELLGANEFQRVQNVMLVYTPDEIEHARRVLLRLSTWGSVKYE